MLLGTSTKIYVSPQKTTFGYQSVKHGYHLWFCFKENNSGASMINEITKTKRHGAAI